jgi:hypothetical protein
MRIERANHSRPKDQHEHFPFIPNWCGWGFWIVETARKGVSDAWLFPEGWRFGAFMSLRLSAWRYFTSYRGKHFNATVISWMVGCSYPSGIVPGACPQISSRLFAKGRTRDLVDRQILAALSREAGPSMDSCVFAGPRSWPYCMHGDGRRFEAGQDQLYLATYDQRFHLP